MKTATTATCAFNNNTDYTLLHVWPAMSLDTQYWDECCMTHVDICSNSALIVALMFSKFLPDSMMQVHVSLQRYSNCWL